MKKIPFKVSALRVVNFDVVWSVSYLTDEHTLTLKGYEIYGPEGMEDPTEEQEQECVRKMGELANEVFEEAIDSLAEKLTAVKKSENESFDTLTSDGHTLHQTAYNPDEQRICSEKKKVS